MYEVDRYELERELGRGGFGAVYLARHKVLGSYVALKVLHAGKSDERDPAIDRFLREARAAASIGNPHIVRVSDAGVTGEQAFLAMEVLEGEDLQSLLRRSQRLPVAEAVVIARQILDGLAAAHAAGIVHRDMKPANVFLVRDERGGIFVKLLDFGISKMLQPLGVEDRLTSTGMVLGTPHYMAPEQLVDTRAVDARGDLYSVGVILYEMLSGRHPYEADTFGALVKEVLVGTPADLASLVPEAPPALVAAVSHALAKEPAHRFQTARQMSDYLDRSLGATPIPTTHPSIPIPAASAWENPHGPTTLPHGGVTQDRAVPPPQQYFAPPPAARRVSGVWIAIGAVLVVVPLTLLVMGLILHERIGHAWAAFVGDRRHDHDDDDPSSVDEPSTSSPPVEAPIPLHDGREESVGSAGISIERCSRRRAADGRWLVDMPLTLHAIGEDSLVFQRSEFSADGYVTTTESDLPQLAMMAPGRATSGYLVWHATGQIPAPDTITVRFRGWVRRVAVTDGPRLSPRRAPGQTD